MPRSETLFGQGKFGSFNPCGYQAVDIPSSVVTLTPPSVNIERVIVRVAGGAVRFRDDKVNPTSTSGFPILQNEGMILDSGFSDLRFIKDSGSAGTVTLDCLWYN